MRNNHYFFLVLLISVGMFISYVGAMCVLDPLQIFHKALAKKDGNLISGMRFQAAGMINNYQFDSIILGTSMAENFSPKEASNILGGRFVNLSLSGSKLSERSLVLNYALKKKKLDRVIMSLDGFAPIGKYANSFPVSNFDFLYDDSKLNDLKIYTNFKYAKYALCQLAPLYSHMSYCHTAFTSLERVVAWWPIKENSRRFGGLDKWFETINYGQTRTAFKNIIRSANCIKNGCSDVHSSYTYKYATNSFEEYVLKYVKKNPSTQFHLFFPPYSRLTYAMRAQETPENYGLYVNAIKFIVYQAELLPNLHIYGFEDMTFLDDLANYKDLSHYHQKFNSMMLRWFKNGEHELSNDMLGEYLGNIKFKANHYDVISIGSDIEKNLKRIELKLD